MNERDVDTPLPQEPAGDVGAIGSILGFHIRLAHGAVYRHFTEIFAELDLTQKQVSALWLVDDHPGIAQADLARRLGMDRATAMAIINRLQGRGFMRRAPSPTDARTHALYLDDAGREMLARAKDAIHAHEKWLKSRFNDREVSTLIELLTRIHG